MKLRTSLLSLLLAVAPAHASAPAGFGLEVLVDGVARPEYAARGAVYVEALRGKDFSLRLTNPLGVRVGVALSVDGLNTIDAKHTSARDARKWVLDPHQTVVIPGWQVSGDTSRRFFFTGETRSYGAALGETANLGTIEAVFFREKQPYRARYEEKISSNEKDRRLDAPAAGAPSAAAPAEPDLDAARDHSQESSSSLSDELAATGIGRRTRFDVTRIALDLESSPAASVRLRYEFRAQLVALGVLPREGRGPMARREAASGFDDWCPQPD